MSPEHRWRAVARQKLDYAVNRPTEEWRVPEWEKVRNVMAEKYSAMLGVPNPITAAIAEVLGLTESTPVVDVPVNMEAFGL